MRRTRTYTPSAVLRETPRVAGGGHPRAQLVAAAAESIAKGSKSFARASQLFDRQTRERAQLLYAWCRRCDDIADGQEAGRYGGGALHDDGSDAKDRVEALRVLSHRAIEGQPTADLAFDALGQVASECGLTHEMADDVIDGFALDAADWHPRTEGDLMRYCFHVAGAVGVMMARVMGVPATDSETLDRACDLGLAFQLGNIARDLCEDDAADRCYLPEEWLVEMDIPPGEHMKPAYRGELVMLARRLVDLAAQHEAAARHGAARLPFRSRWAVLAAANIYGAIGRAVAARGGAAWDHRVYTSKAAKLGFVVQALWQALVNRPAAARPPKWTRAALEAMADADAAKRAT